MVSSPYSLPTPFPLLFLVPFVHSLPPTPLARPPSPLSFFFGQPEAPVQSARTLGLVFENSQMLHNRLRDPIMWVDLIMHEAEAGAAFPLLRTRRGELIHPFSSSATVHLKRKD